MNYQQEVSFGFFWVGFFFKKPVEMFSQDFTLGDFGRDELKHCHTALCSDNRKLFQCYFGN